MCDYLRVLLCVCLEYQSFCADLCTRLYAHVTISNDTIYTASLLLGRVGRDCVVVVVNLYSHSECMQHVLHNHVRTG